MKSVIVFEVAVVIAQYDNLVFALISEHTTGCHFTKFNLLAEKIEYLELHKYNFVLKNKKFHKSFPLC